MSCPGEDVRHKVASWFGRGQPDRKVLDRLDACHAELTKAAPAALERLQQALAQHWAGRINDLIADHPYAAGELDGLVQQIQAATATGHLVATGAHGGLRAAHVQCGSGGVPSMS